MKRLDFFGTSLSLIKTAGILGDRNEDLSLFGNQYVIPHYGYELSGKSVLIGETVIRVRNEYTPPNVAMDVFFFETCVVYDTVGGLIVVRDAK
jgi:hypothetical protein